MYLSKWSQCTAQRQCFQIIYTVLQLFKFHQRGKLHMLHQLSLMQQDWKRSLVFLLLVQDFHLNWGGWQAKTVLSCVSEVYRMYRMLLLGFAHTRPILVVKTRNCLYMFIYMYGTCVFCKCISALFVCDQIFLVHDLQYRLQLATLKPQERMAEKLRRRL